MKLWIARDKNGNLWFHEGKPHINKYAEKDNAFDLHYLKEPLTAEEVRELASLGWSLGYDCDYDEEIMAPWLNPSEHTDEELMVLWNEYKTIHKYA